MSHIEFVYYDTVYNESVFTHTYDGPFVDKMEFELVNTQVPCDEEYAHVTRVRSSNSVIVCNTEVISLIVFSAIRTDRNLLLRVLDPAHMYPDHARALHHHAHPAHHLLGGGRAGPRLAGELRAQGLDRRLEAAVRAHREEGVRGDQRERLPQLRVLRGQEADSGGRRHRQRGETGAKLSEPRLCTGQSCLE